MGQKFLEGSRKVEFRRKQGNCAELFFDGGIQ